MLLLEYSFPIFTVNVRLDTKDIIQSRADLLFLFQSIYVLEYRGLECQKLLKGREEVVVYDYYYQGM